MPVKVAGQPGFDNYFRADPGRVAHGDQGRFHNFSNRQHFSIKQAVVETQPDSRMPPCLEFPAVDVNKLLVGGVIVG